MRGRDIGQASEEVEEEGEVPDINPRMVGGEPVEVVVLRERG